MEQVSPILEDEPEERGNRLVSFRGRSLKTSGKPRNRYECYDDRILIDFSKPIDENIRDAFAGCLNMGTDEVGPSKQIRLNHLNNLVKLIENYVQERRQTDQKNSPNHSACSSSTVITFEQILLCLRCMLVDEEREIRAAALRVLRYLLQSDKDLVIALKLHVDILIARCLDVVLDNRLERNQCMRLILSLIHHCPSVFPSSLVHCLLSISLDGHDEKDKMARAATAALSELAVRNPDLVMECGGVGWLIRSVLMSGHSTARLAECLTTVMASLYNQRRYRQRYQRILKNVFYDVLAPLMDEYYKLTGIDTDEKTPQMKMETEQVLDNCKAAVVAALRTWPGLIGCFSCSSEPESSSKLVQSPIYALVASLCLDSMKVREFAVDAICEILNIDIPDNVSFEEYKFSLTQQFVNADAKGILGDLNKRRRPNLTDQMMALIFLGLVDSGVINALVRVIVRNPMGSLETKTTHLLAGMLDMCGRFLPSSYKQRALCLASIIQMIDGDGNFVEGDTSVDCVATFSIPLPTEVQREHAILLAYRLRDLSVQSKEQSTKIRTVQMEQLISKFYSKAQGDMADDGVLSGTMDVVKHLDRTNSRIHTLKSEANITRSASLPADGHSLTTKLSPDRVHELIRDSRTTVPYSNHTAWDWSLIYLALCQICEHRQHIDDGTCPKFTNQLIQFFDPVGGQFCKMTEDYTNYTRVGCVLMRVLGNAAWDSSMGVQLRTLLSHLVSNLMRDRLHVGQLSVKNLLGGSCADYFIFIGQLSDTEMGRLALERTGMVQRLSDLISSDSHDAFVKLIISSILDYDRRGTGRMLLQKSLTSTKESCRLYSTSFLSTLGKLKVPDFADWGMEMLINQLRDNSRAVVEEAVNIIEELINDEEYLNSLVRLRPSLLPLGDAGILLLTYVMSNEVAVSAMIKQQSNAVNSTTAENGNRCSSSPQPVAADNFVGREIERWKSVFNVKYARIVDERLCETFSSYSRTVDGSFPRHASRNVQTISDVFVPPHLYGQLARHTTGCQILQNYTCLDPLLNMLHTQSLTNENDILNMKAAMWALGNVASTELGYNLLPSSITGTFVSIAAECPLLSLRGCAFYILNLIAQSGPVARGHLRQHGWDSTCPFPTSLHDTVNDSNSCLLSGARVEPDIFDTLGYEKTVYVCLPVDINLLCKVNDWHTESSSISSPAIINVLQIPISSYYPAKNHTSGRCLHCQPSSAQVDLNHISMESNDKDTTANDHQFGPQSAFRKELFRLVTLLSVRKKYAEQGLLRLKQEAPQLFRSLCVYSDVSDLMSNFTFRLSARRFLQELFQDVDFGDLWSQPRRIVLGNRDRHCRLPLTPSPV